MSTKPRPLATTEEVAFNVAFAKTTSARARLTPSELLNINIDVQSAVDSVLAIQPQLMELREDLVNELPTFDVSLLEKLDVYAGSLAHAHVLYVAGTQSEDILPELLERAAHLRELLYTDGTALALRGLVDAKRLAEVKNGNGYLNTAADLGVLCRLFRERWDAIESNSGVKKAELDEAYDVFQRITRDHAKRSRQASNNTVNADARTRAFTLLVRTYDEVRRAVSYLRWHHDDIDKIMPSLYQNSGGSRRNSGNEKPVDPPRPPTDDVAPGATSPHAPTEPSVPVAPPTDTAPGLPGGSPFANG